MFENISGRTWHKRLQQNWDVDENALKRAFIYFRDKFGYDIRDVDCFERSPSPRQTMNFSIGSIRKSVDSHSQSSKASSSSSQSSKPSPSPRKSSTSQKESSEEEEEDEEDVDIIGEETASQKRKRKRGRNYSNRSLGVLNECVQEILPFLGT